MASKKIVGFTERFNEVIFESGKMPSEIAKNIGLSKSNIYYQINGYCLPSLFTFMKFCKYMNVSADYLLFGKEGETNDKT